MKKKIHEKTLSIKPNHKICYDLLSAKSFVYVDIKAVLSFI